MLKFDKRYSRRLSTEEKKDCEDLIHNIMYQMVNSSVVKVVYHGYRSACVEQPIFDAERDSMFPFECMLALKAGKHIDNHVVYELHYGIVDKFYFQFSDDLCRVGKSIVKENW